MPGMGNVTLGSDMCSAFGILGLTQDSTFEETKNAYRRLIKCWHPDRFPYADPLKPHAERRMREINIAYETLKLHFGQPLTETVAPQPKPAPVQSRARKMTAGLRKRALTGCYVVMRRKRKSPRTVRIYNNVMHRPRMLGNWFVHQGQSLKAWWNAVRQAAY